MHRVCVHPSHATLGMSKLSRKAAIFTRTGSSPGKLRARFLPQNQIRAATMKRILLKAGLVLAAATVPVTAAAQAALEGKWANPKRSVIVSVARCGDAYCGT